MCLGKFTKLAFMRFDSKSIDFVKISKTDDWWDTLTAEQQNSINKGIEQLDNGEGIAHNKVRKNVNKLLGKDE